MYTAAALLDLHERAHRSLEKLLAHCSTLSAEEFDRELPGFGYPSVRLQLHHEIGAEQYWIGVLEGRMQADDDEAEYPTLESLQEFRAEVFVVADRYLRGASEAELNTPREMVTFGGHTRTLIPALVVVRTATHLYQHQGQISAMCRLFGHPIPAGLDFPLV